MHEMPGGTYANHRLAEISAVDRVRQEAYLTSRYRVYLHAMTFFFQVGDDAQKALQVADRRLVHTVLFYLPY
jgi:hypothetical protein